jgi:serine/threonine protein kinase
MSSNRSETSIPGQNSSAAPQDVVEKSLSVITTSQYVPQANDLVMALLRMLRASKVYIPSAFLQSEAVDSSLLLGHGASFTVTRQAVPRGHSTMADRLDFGRFVSLIMPFQPAKRPQYVVYKSPRIQFQPNGEPIRKDRRALQSVLTEIHALLHPPLLRHANIIDILGVAWGSNSTNPAQRLPVLVVEYGDKGTLADVQVGNSPLSNELKRQIALGIASGLQALHDESIVHGDLKPENIIMCSDEQKILVPKLGDFGFAIIAAAEAPNVMLGGTRPWRAPESHSFLPVSMLKFTDVYSFGLVAWSVALDGKEPFDIIIPDYANREEKLLEFDHLKTDDQLKTLSSFEKWVPSWLRSRAEPEGEVKTDDHRSGTDSINPSDRFGDRSVTPVTCTSLRGEIFFGSLERVLISTLSLHPTERDLSLAIRFLEETAAEDAAT